MKSANDLIHSVGRGVQSAGRSAQSLFKRRIPPGSSPGTLVVHPDAPKPRIFVLDFDSNNLNEREIQDVSELSSFRDSNTVTWIDVQGLGDVELIGRLGEIFGLHRLALEDAVHTGQRAKVESYDDHLFIIARMILLREHLETEQVSFFLGPNWVLTFQEKPGDVFEPVRQRIRGGRGKIRTGGTDYLTYALLDAIVDHYFPVLEAYGDQLAGLEERVVSSPDYGVLMQIYALKRDLLSLRRAIWPAREAFNSLVRDESELIQKETVTFLRDCYDHAVQVIDLVENYRELSTGLMDAYLSGVSNRMNEVMKVLTVIATIFIPLTFVAGIYGMNFNPERSPWNMPELNAYFGYPLAILGMLGIGIGLVVFFRKKQWF
ncbi:MAG: magnesium/cobalt transporter CorA [Candidatus Omnitrophica bacterium]|nr:magnesium/cobalt transporter CorA [Candidatus Omnitrophota bacterium]